MITMSCQDFLARVSDFIDGDLDGEWRQAVSEHARGCLHCAVILDTTRRTVRLAGDPELFSIPPQVADRLHGRIAAALRSLPATGETPVAARDSSSAANGEPNEAASEAGDYGDFRTPAWAAASGARGGPSLRPERRGFLGGWNWPLSWAVIGAILIIFGGLNWWQQTRVRTLQGWLIDAHCAVRFIAARTAPTDHARWCLLQPACESSGYGVLTEGGVFWPFNSAGTREALTMLQSSGPSKDLRVIVRGQERGRRLYVRALRWAQPKNLISVRLRLPAAPGPAAIRPAAYLPATGW